MGPGEGSSSGSGWLLDGDAQVDHFQVIRPIGRGGMAEVYLARDTKLGRKVALKMIAPEALGSQEAVERFLFEARTTARFNHQHIVTIHAVGEANSRPYVALEYLEGQSLAERLDRDRPGLHESMRIGLAVAQALAQAHAEGILHRDLKPGNIMLASDGRLRVLDFGLAGVLKQKDPSLQTSLQAPKEIQEIWGTPGYMAPEQWEEQETTGATDVWALGVVLYELIRGEPPYHEETFVKQALKVCSPEPAPRVDGAVPEELSELIADCLEKDPAKRPAAADLVERLQNMLMHKGADQVYKESPFRGLLPFSEEHRHFFFGRDEEIAAFVERLRQQPLLAVVGPSGAGKTSFIQAGLVPRLREQGPLEVLQLRPGADPFRTLANRIVAARPRSATGPEEVQKLSVQIRASAHFLNFTLQLLAEQTDSNVLLFVDQLEELYTLVPEQDTRRQFMRAICLAADDAQMPVRVVLTLREEFLSRLSEGSGVQEALSHIMVARSPGPEALLETLTRPVEVVGYEYDDPTLAQVMVSEVHGEVSCLPLLQFAGQQLWERRDKTRRQLKRSVYQEIGGVVGALARHADGVLKGLATAEVRLARTILLRLVTPEKTRRVLSRFQVLEGLDPKAEQVLKRLTQARLITGKQSEEEGEGELELVHESLIAAWGRLSRWIDESREELLFLAEVSQAAQMWAKHGRHEHHLWVGEPLREADRAAGRCSTELSERVKSFLSAGRAKERRRIWGKRFFRAAVVITLALIAGIYAWKEREASAQREVAEQQRAEAQRESAKSALTRGSPLEARAKLKSSLTSQDSVAGRALWRRLEEESLVWMRKLGNVINGVAYSPDGKFIAAACFDRSIYLIDVNTTEARVLRGHESEVQSVAFSHDGGMLASAGADATVRLWTTASGSLDRVLRGHTDIVTSVAFDPQGRYLASAGLDRTIRLWDLKPGSGSLAEGLLSSVSTDSRILEGHTDRIWSVAFSPDGAHLVSGSKDRTLRIWDVSAARQKKVLEGHAGEIAGVCFNPDGSRVASAGGDRTARIWDARSGELVRVLKGHRAQVRSVAFNPDGKLLATGSLDRTVRFWNASSGELSATLQGHSDDVISVAFSSDGRHLATGSWDQTVRLWAVGKETSHPLPRGHAGIAVGVSFSPDGRVVASGGFDQTIRLWDVASGAQLKVLEGHTAPIMDVAFSPAGDLIASASWDRTVRLWEAESGLETRVLEGHRDFVVSLAFSSDGRLLASGSWDQTARVWDVASGALLKELKGHKDRVWGVAFSPGGEWLATSAWDAVVRLWELSSGKELRAMHGHPFFIFDVAFNPTGDLLASGGFLGTIRLWDPKTGKQLQALKGHNDRVFGLSFSPDGKLLASGSEDESVRIWDLADFRHREIVQPAEVNYLHFSPDAKLVATAGQDGGVRLFDIESGRLFWRAPVLLPGRDHQPLLYSHHGWTSLDGRSAAAPVPGKSQWRSAVEAARQVSTDESGSFLCVRTQGEKLELWDRIGDRPLPGTGLDGVKDVLALGDACLVLAEGRAHLVEGSGKSKELCQDAVAIGGDSPARILVAASGKVLVFERSGRQIDSYDTGPGVSAVLLTGNWLVLGRQEGNLELVPALADLGLSGYSFEEVHSSTPVRMLDGPAGTLFVGFADGAIGLWELESGALLEQVKLHGPVMHMLLKEGKLYAATELGDYLAWDLDVYYRDHCRLVREIWNQVPVIWEGGRPVHSRPSRDHRCFKNRER